MVTNEGAHLPVPREHGATAMLLTPFFAAAILLKRLYWPELAAFAAALSAFMIKDPLIVLARQRFVWKQPHPETAGARRTALVLLLLLTVSGGVLFAATDWRPLVPVSAAAAAFFALAVTLNVRNRHRAEWFQAASAVALSATCVVVCLAATGSIPSWCWLLWFLCALQATAGVFVVHARLDARIAARKPPGVPAHNRRAAFVCVFALLSAAVAFAWLGSGWIAAALSIASAGYLAELMRQKSPESLQTPLKRIGLEALTLATAYSLLIVAGLWNR